MKNLTEAPIRRPARQFFRDRWYAFALAAVVLLSFWLNFYAISKLGYGNAYYAAAVRSMTQSWHNFFYISFDPAGLVSVDKPPLGLWVQALFVMAFGYHGWAMLLPQALAGAASSAMMYILTAKRFGRPAGLISALVFAVTPAVVVASRNNTMDMQLILVLLVAAWFLFRSIETGKWRWLFLCAVMIGVGFNVKMLQAYMIIPAVVAVYLLCAKEKLSRRFLAGTISVVVMAGVSFAWVAAVDLTPAANRPYVGSSTNNTEWELILGHNGMERVSGGMGAGGMGGNMRGGTGDDGGFRRGNGQNGGFPGGQNNQTPPNGQANGTGGFTNNQNGQTQQGNQANQTPQNGQTRQGGWTNRRDGGDGGGAFGRARTGGAVGNDIGTAGPFRLWQQSMYGQASWLLIPALFCLLACVGKPRKKKLTPKQGVLLFWVLWLLVIGAFFSFASFYHRYYLCMLAPGIAGVIGIGFPELFRAFRMRKGWKQWLMPFASASSSAFSAWYVWAYYPALRAALFPVIAGFGAASLVAMAVYLLRPKKAVAFAAAGLMAVSQLSGSFYWALTSALYVCENVTMPYAGPELAETASTPGMTANQGTFVSSDSSTKSLENYLVKNYKKGSYLVVGQRANDVAELIVDTGLPAVAYGGFLGSDKSLTLAQFKQQVAEGKITYVLVSSQTDGMGGMSEIGSMSRMSANGGGMGGMSEIGGMSRMSANGGGMGGMDGNSSSEISSYIASNATKVDSSEYGGSTSFGTLYVFSSASTK